MNRTTALAAALVTTAALSLATPPTQAQPPTAVTTSVQTEAEHVISFEHQWQETGYWCGPAATRVALTAAGQYPSQADLAAELPTDEGGTDHISQVTDVLNAHGAGNYVTTEMPNDPPTAEQEQKLWDDVVRTVDQDRAVVANIVAPPSNHPPGYPSDQTIYHYFAVVGYNAETSQVYIADSAGFSQGTYWLDFHQLATLVPPKGYSAIA
ncbi:C39 family peptidase [Solicola gregarius]|uniref:C39 family peptidase n=1 Tax=Solicola gregarius TaxID=2908642 RepID=A0AA46TJ36_9ACTN|nr:C39 family peptidase [Solicola gregarius]UYM06171.1 C39 family peptidase [Solicola gregarius]